MRDRHDPRRVPSNSDARFHFTFRRQKRWLYRNVEPRPISFHMKNELILGMLADVFEQGNRAVDWRLVKSANDVARAQPGSRRGRVRLHFVDARCLRRIDQKLTHTFSAPSPCLGLVWFHPNCLNLAIALEFHGNLVAFTSHYIPAHAVIHSEKTPDRFPVHFENFIAGLESNSLRRRIRQDVTDNRGGIRFANRMADHPHDAGKKSARSRLNSGPAMATMILSSAEIFGSLARSTSALPSIMSIGASCGNATNPPKGSEPREYCTPLIVFFQSGLPNQTPNFSM